MNKELFVEYHKIKKEVAKETKKYEKLLDEKAEYFLNTQPKSSDPSIELIVSGGNSDKYLFYLAKIEELDKKINNQRNILDIRKYRLKLKKQELEESNDVLDKIYIYSYIKGLKVGRYYRKVGYSRAQVYRKLEEIEEKLKDETK